MKTAIDASGRVLIPKLVRDAAALVPGAELEVRVEDGRVILSPAPAALKMERKGRFLVAAPEGDVPPLETATVEETRRRLRKNRRDA